MSLANGSEEEEGRDPEERRRHVAYHESGHAVLSLFYGRDFQYVTIRPDPEHGFSGQIFYGDVSSQKTVEASLEERAMRTLAGEAATFILTGERDPEAAGRLGGGAVGDTKSMFEYLCKLYELGEDTNDPAHKAAHHHWEWLWWRTVLLISQPPHWESVEAIARELIARETLTQEECEKVLSAEGCLFEAEGISVRSVNVVVNDENYQTLLRAASGDSTHDNEDGQDYLVANAIAQIVKQHLSSP